MDPALWELLKSSADRDDQEVEAIIRLDDPQVDVAGVRIVSRFGRIATCRLLRDSVLGIRRDDDVLSLKAPRALGPEEQPNSTQELPLALLDRDIRRPPHLALTGARVCVGIVDWGCDFDHPNFKRSDGSTRLFALWDQRGPAASGSTHPYGYGTVYSSAEIDDALRTADPYDALGYHPADADRDDSGAHGTFVMDIAAGNGLAGGPPGIAPDADLFFVHLADRGTGGLANLGDSVRVLEAVDFIARTAGHRPWVINLSVGRHGGPHDGTTLAELALDFALRAAPGRFIVQSTGNYFDKSCHASGRLEAGQVHALTLVTSEADVTSNELEVWYSGGDELVVQLESPSGVRSPPVRLGEQADIVEDERIVGRLYHRDLDPNNLDNHIELFLYSWASAGSWVVTLQALKARSGVFHAWLERDEFCADCQAHFPSADSDSLSTTGTIANGQIPLVVGAFDASSPTREVAHFSSAGPTRDGRLKPDLVASGVQVLAARSAPRGSRRSPGMFARKSGTSFAAPHVTGAVALCLQGAPRLLTGAEIRALLLRSVEPVSSNGNSSSRFGYGYLDVDNVVAAVSALDRRVRALNAYRSSRANQPEHDSKEPEMQPDLEHAIRVSLGPDKLYREVVYRRGGPLCAWIDEAFVVLARPGESPNEPPEAGDLLVRVALGEPSLGHVALLSDSTLAPPEALEATRVRSERAGPGLYTTVIEGGAFPHTLSDRFARRVLDGTGRMPLGQVLLRPRRSLASAPDPLELDLDVGGSWPEEDVRPPVIAHGLEVGEGSPLAGMAVDQCWQRTQDLRGNSAAADAPNKVSGDRIRAETGLRLEANPYWGITRQEIEAVVRAGYESHQMPEVLLALWATEGSTESVTTPMPIRQASNEANARAICRSIIYYNNLGMDHFVDTTRPDPHGDNKWDPSDAAAPQNERRFVEAIRRLASDGLLSEEISGAINAELTVTQDSAGTFAVLPTTRFYTLSLLAMDALFTKWLNLSYQDLPSISVPMNYLQWNMGTGNFATFLQSAEGHRAEPRFPGAPISLEQWALETPPRADEYRLPRTNAIRFKHYVESYRPIFNGAMTLIKPGIEDIPPPADAASFAGQLGTSREDVKELIQPQVDEVRDHYAPVCLERTEATSPPNAKQLNAVETGAPCTVPQYRFEGGPSVQRQLVEDLELSDEGGLEGPLGEDAPNGDAEFLDEAWGISGWGQTATLYTPDSTLVAHPVPAALCGVARAADGTPSIRPVADIQRVIIHVLQSKYAQSIATWQAGTGTRGCHPPHYVIRRDGEITQMVAEQHIAYHARKENARSIGIEHDGWTSSPGFYTEAMYLASAALVRDICQRNGLPVDREHIIGHDEVAYKPHGDPGGYWDWDYYMALVQWNGTSAARRPLRLVLDASSPSVWPTTDLWHTRDRDSGQAALRVAREKRGPDDRQAYGQTYFWAKPDPAAPEGDAVVFTAEVPEAGRWRLSVWWPVLATNNQATVITVSTTSRDPTQRTLSAHVSQHERALRTRPTPALPRTPVWYFLREFLLRAGEVVSVTVSRRTDAPGRVVADAIRLLRV